MKRIVYSFISVCITLAVLEMGLRTLDPWGAFAYYSDTRVLRQHYVSVTDNRVYTLPPTTLKLRHWSITMTADGRRVPHSAESECVLAFVGDSYTFGHGVNDGDTFADAIARQLPDWSVHNLGIDGYNTVQVLETVQRNKAVVYVYLLIGNDIEPVSPTILTPEPMSLIQGLRVYNYYFGLHLRHQRTVLADAPPAIPNWFTEALAVLAARDDVVMVGFSHDVIAQYAASEYTRIGLIPKVRHTISKADGHPNAQGHQQIADSILPYLPVEVFQGCEV